MAIYRGVGGSGDSATGEDVFGDNSSITSLNGLSGAIQTPTYIKFAANANHTASQGELTWNTAEGTLDLGLNHGGVVLQIGQELHYRVTNQSGSNIPNGTLVAFVGTTGNSGKLLVDVYDGTQASKAILGLTTETIVNGTNGYVTSFGKVRGIQTNGANYGETWVDGDILYPSPTGLTKVLPQAPAAKQPIAVVVNAHGSNGELFVRVQSGTTLAEDELVQLTALANGDVLQYNGTTGRFENVDASIVAGSISDGDKGDITVSSSGTVWTVDNDAITYAKIQNVSATDKLLGRSSVGAGDIEEITCTQAGRDLLDDANASAQRTTLGLGTIATQAANNVSITGGSITGITDLAVADGGTGVSTLTGIVKGNGTSAFSAAVAGTDYLAPAAIGTTVLAYDSNLQSFVNTFTLPTTDGTANQVLQTNGSGTLSFANLGSTNKAWVNFNGTGTVAIRASFNVSSITDRGTGLYTMNFITAMPDTNYAGNATAAADLTANTRNHIGTLLNWDTTFAYINTFDTGGAAQDCVVISAAVFR